MSSLVISGYVPPQSHKDLMDVYEKDAVYKPLLVAELWPTGTGTPIESNLKKAPKWQIDKLMIHPTDNRTDSHDWTCVINIVARYLEPVIADVRQNADET